MDQSGKLLFGNFIISSEKIRDETLFGSSLFSVKTGQSILQRLLCLADTTASLDMFRRPDRILLWKEQAT
jgi:hypothetical protein